MSRSDAAAAGGDASRASRRFMAVVKQGKERFRGNALL
jgi:hypothetical protein